MTFQWVGQSQHGESKLLPSRQPGTENDNYRGTENNYRGTKNYNRAIEDNASKRKLLVIQLEKQT